MRKKLICQSDIIISVLGDENVTFDGKYYTYKKIKWSESGEFLDLEIISNNPEIKATATLFQDKTAIIGCDEDHPEPRPNKGYKFLEQEFLPKIGYKVREDLSCMDVDRKDDTQDRNYTEDNNQILSLISA